MLQALRQCVEQLGFDKTYWVAYSGGMDSHVLLSLCATLRQEHSFDLRVIHLNHQLNPAASQWATHCAHVCEALHIPLTQTALTPQALNTNIEATLREQRYAVFAAHMKVHDILLTAHHQNDQAETLLLQLFRGAGVKGLAAMPAIKAFAHGHHARPLLSFSREVLHHYALEHKLHWIEDDSNTNTQYTRNFLRHNILPALAERWPTLPATLSRTAQHCAEAQTLLDSFAISAYEQTIGSSAETLSVKRLADYTSAQQRLILRTWITARGYSCPDTRKMETIQKTVLTAAWDRLPCVTWQAVTLRRYQDDLYLSATLPTHVAAQTYAWDLQTPLAIPDVGTLQTISSPNGLPRTLDSITVRFRQGGEVAYFKQTGHRTLKNLFNEWKVLPWLRNRLPLIFRENELICIPGYYLNETVQTSQDGINITFSCL